MQRTGRSRVYAKRKTTSKSRSRTPWRGKTARKSYSAVTRAIAGPSTGLGQSARTILKTDILYNALFDAAGLIRFTLKPGSCFDPTGDASGIQPALYDQWAATYGRYVVEKAYVCIEFANNNANASPNGPQAFTAAAYPTINAATLATYQGAASQPYAKSILHGPYDNSSTSKLVFQLDHAKVLGRKGSVNAEDNGALTGSDPSTNQFMVMPVFINSVLASATQPGVAMRIRIFQTVWFDRRINVVDA